jgi:hypothetical protein
MGFLLDSYGISMVFLCFFVISMIFLYGITMGFLLDSCVISMGCPWWFFGISLGFHRDVYGICMGFYQISM